jgi:cyclophilin family peptidyl-prolyl cis-trans isomerase/HEAT repeat protein
MTTKFSALLVVLLLSGSIVSCGRSRLLPEQVRRNQVFAEILKHEDLRQLGNDDFFPVQLRDSPDPQVQQWCALALGRIGDPRALPWLYEALHAQYVAVRATAAFAIGEIEDQSLVRNEGRIVDAHAVNALLPLMYDPAVQVRARAVEAIGKIGSAADAIPIIRRMEKYAYDAFPDEMVFLNCVITSLMRLKNNAARPVLTRLADIDDPEIQWRVANAFYRMRDKDARPVLERLLTSRNTDVQAHAARALGICGDAGIAARLQPLLMPAQSGRATPLSVRVSALQALVNLKSTASASAIQDASLAAPIGPSEAQASDWLNFAVQGIAALGILGSDKNVPCLVSLSRRRGAVADAAVVSLAKLLRGTPDRFFDSFSDPRVRRPWGLRTWATALGELAGPRAQEELRWMLARTATDAPGEEQRLAIPAILGALKQAKTPGLNSILPAYLMSHDGVVVRAALAAYAPEAGAVSPWKPVLQAYQNSGRDMDLETKMAILDKLQSWISSAEVRAIFESMLQDRERNIRNAAARMLRPNGVAGVPDNPGPPTTRATEQTYTQAAAARQERTIAEIETNRGIMEVELFRQDAPLTVANFIALANEGFFNGLQFMRVVPYFVIQGGDPRNDQEGGPGYSIRCEINMHPFERGSVGMALSGKDTGGSQFFVALSPQPHLDGGYTCFGRIISGMPVAEHIVAGDRIQKIRIKEEKAILDFRRY